MTEVAAAARRTLRAGSARIRRDVFDPEGERVVAAYEGVADLAARRVRLDPVGGGLSRVYGDGALRHEAVDGTWVIADPRVGRGDPLAILDWLLTAVARPVPGTEDVRGVPCERLEFRTTGAPLVIGRGWVGTDDRLRRADWRAPSGSRVRIELWAFGVDVEVEVPAAELPQRAVVWRTRARMLEHVLRRR